MAISQRLSRANSITTDENNLVVGTLISVETTIETFPNEETGEVEEIEQIEWIWEVPTKLGKPTRIHEWTGFTVNSEKSWHNGKELVYNKLTQILLQTELIDVETIDEIDLEELDIESLLNRKFEFELEKRPNKKKSVKSVKLSTLKLV